MVCYDKFSCLSKVQEKCCSCEVYRKKKRSKTSYDIKLGQNHPEPRKPKSPASERSCVTPKEHPLAGVGIAARSQLRDLRFQALSPSLGKGCSLPSRQALS